MSAPRGRGRRTPDAGLGLGSGRGVSPCDAVLGLARPYILTQMRGLSRDRANLLLLVGLGSVLVLWYLGSEVYMLSGGLGFPLDDSWIHLAFARNLANGEGLALNQGELVTGSTAPLWTGLLSLVFLIPGAAIPGTKLLGAVFYLLGVAATYGLARELGVRPGLASLAAGLTAGTSWLVWGALSGMEIPLFVLLSVFGMTLHIRERANPGRVPLSLLVLAVASLARPEGQLLVLLALVDRLVAPVADLRSRITVAARGLILVVLAVAPVLLFNYAVGGTTAPTTLDAKTAGLSRFLPHLDYQLVVLGIWFSAQPLMTLLCGGGVARLLSRWGEPGDRGVLPALWLVALPLAFSTMSPPGSPPVVGNFGRYFFPLFPVVIVLGVLALEPLAERLGTGATANGRSWAAALAMGLVVLPTLPALSAGASTYARNVANVEDSNVALAHWLAQRVPPDAVLAVNDIGAFKFLLPNPILDLAGIAHPEVRQYTARATAEGRPWQSGIMDFLEVRRPEYLIVFPAWFPDIVRRQEDFRAVHAVTIPDNITMGADEIGVFTTPWTSPASR